MSNLGEMKPMRAPLRAPRGSRVVRIRRMKVGRVVEALRGGMVTGVEGGFGERYL